MTNCEHFRFLSSDGKTQLHGCTWDPGGKNQVPGGVLQIAHGVAEHIERYDDFARFLNSQGIVVAGHDHLGRRQVPAPGRHAGIFRGKGRMEARGGRHPRPAPDFGQAL